ncbi:MAG: PAS domain S-box protein [Ignavibacteria bacterium]|nr:PAS domain S-box protein [Ignavibacteria bacterium]
MKANQINSKLNLILEALENSDCSLSSEAEIDVTISNCLKQIGELLELNSAFIVKFKNGENKPQKILYSWEKENSGNISSDFLNSLLKEKQIELHDFLKKNKSLQISKNSQEHSSFLQLLGAEFEKILFFPIILENDLWGYLCFLDKIKGRTWSESEIIAIKLYLNNIKIVLLAKHCREKLSQSEEQYRTIVDKALDAIYLMKNKRYEYVNPRFAELTGYSIAELTAEDFSFETLICEESKLYMQKRYEARLKGEEIDNKYEVSILRKDGTTVPVEISTVSVGTSSEVAVLGIIRNISERKRYENELKERERSYRTLTENIPGLVYRYYPDEGRKVVFYNDFTENIFGILAPGNKSSYDKLLNVYILFEDRYRVEREVEKAIRSKQIMEIEFRIKDYHGNIKHLLTRGKPVFDKNNNLISIDGVFYDHTKQKELEKELKETIASKDKFFSIIAHDLKGPLAGFLGYTKYLLEDYSKLTFNEINAVISLLNESANKIYVTLEDLLDWARTQTGKIKYRPELVDLREIAFNVAYVLKQSASNKEINLISNIKEEAIVEADRNMIVTVVRNLVSNAIKFTEANGEVTISAKKITGLHEGANKEFYQISVEDNGVGIDEIEMSKLFKIDETISTVGTTGEVGTGLGLILCKEFVEKHGGRIWVESKVGKGSKFSFTIPALNE